MADAAPYGGVSIRQAILRLSGLISRLDESQSRNPSEVLGYPADEVTLNLIRDVMHYIPEGDPIFPTLRRYITDPRASSGEIMIVHVLPMLEMLRTALTDELTKKESPESPRRGGANVDSPKGDFEPHHRHRPRLPSVSAYHPEIRASDPDELAYFWPYRRPK